ncbi:hypothetical protein CS379_19735 [Methylobacterium frigidaeris]|uniref:Uncharacterized protein n=2 Tax=Methylobacterium frigidaeris TaxID=2038277 RepID=A0AA37HHW5_9HYPH|nr:hypothetical protein CS379_19735 [Methylobacterium frigidaeris]GJD66211.1 hypothetical protein MPEAHAMD_6408 [Methylobacterium frigidaeris]
MEGEKFSGHSLRAGFTTAAAGHHLDKSHPAIRGIRCTCEVAQRHVEAITVPVLRRLLDVRDRSLRF